MRRALRIGLFIGTLLGAAACATTDCPPAGLVSGQATVVYD